MSPLSEFATDIAQRTARVADEVHRHALVTPLLAFDGLSAACGATVLVKCEHQQRTGSFKVRGALAKLADLPPADRERGVVTASSGNHGLGFAYALSVYGGTGFVCVPASASPVKVAAIRRYGVEVRELGSESGETERLARALADENGWTYVSPYNDPQIAAGQGTIGAEILRQANSEPIDAVVVAVGGGGLISGVAATIRTHLPEVTIVGASPANDAAMAASVAAGRVVDVDARPTISDGTAGGVEPGAITVPLCAELVDEWRLVPEPDIFAALRLTIDTEHQLVEGAAATALAAGLALGRERPGARIVVVSCGANISADTLALALGS